MSLLWIFNTRF